MILATEEVEARRQQVVGLPEQLSEILSQN